MRNFGFPYRIDTRGVTADSDDNVHIRDLIEQILFTSVTERVNRPTFGSGLINLLFAPGSDEVATATQFLVQGSLQQYLGDRIAIDSVTATSDEGSLIVTVQYTIKNTGQQIVEQFARGA